MREAKGVVESRKRPHEDDDLVASTSATTSYFKQPAAQPANLATAAAHAAENRRSPAKSNLKLSSTKPGDGASTSSRSTTRSSSSSSSRLSFSLAPTAASRLLQLASHSRDNPLAKLGILSVTIGDSQPVHFPPPPAAVSNGEPPTKKPRKAHLQESKVSGGLLELLRSLVAIRGNKLTMESGESDSNSLRQPNVVATGNEPIPVSSMTNPTPAGPFPFSSMTKSASATSTTTFSKPPSASASVVPSPEPINQSRLIPSPQSSPEIPLPMRHTTKATHRTNIAQNSPLLVNLLQGSESSSSSSTPQSANRNNDNNRVRNPRRKKEEILEIIPSSEKLVKAPRAPRKKKSKLGNGDEIVTNGVLPNGTPGNLVNSAGFYSVFTLPTTNSSGVRVPNNSKMLVKSDHSSLNGENNEGVVEKSSAMVTRSLSSSSGFPPPLPVAPLSSAASYSASPPAAAGVVVPPPLKLALSYHPNLPGISVPLVINSHPRIVSNGPVIAVDVESVPEPPTFKQPTVPKSEVKKSGDFSSSSVGRVISSVNSPSVLRSSANEPPS